MHTHTQIHTLTQHTPLTITTNWILLLSFNSHLGAIRHQIKFTIPKLNSNFSIDEIVETGGYMRVHYTHTHNVYLANASVQCTASLFIFIDRLSFVDILYIHRLYILLIAGMALFGESRGNNSTIAAAFFPAVRLVLAIFVLYWDLVEVFISMHPCGSLVQFENRINLNTKLVKFGLVRWLCCWWLRCSNHCLC